MRAARSALLGAALGGSLTGCFQAPAFDVMFACDPARPACPDGYRCQPDGCCHRDGGDVEANLGACRVGPPSSADPDDETTDATDAEPETGPDETTEATDGGLEADPDEPAPRADAPR